MARWRSLSYSLPPTSSPGVSPSRVHALASLVDRLQPPSLLSGIVRFSLGALTAFGFLASSGAVAQSTAAPADSARPTRAVSRAVFARSDLGLAAGLVGGALITMPFDERVAHWLQRPSLHQA